MPDLIYPGDYFQSVDPRDEDGTLCFVLMPFADEYRKVFDEGIKPTVEFHGLRCLRADDIYSPRPILVSVMDHIARARVVIADLSARNANVFYELGMTHVRKPNERVILIAQNLDDIPFDLQHLRFIVYSLDQGGFEKLRSDLSRMIAPLAADPESADDVEETEATEDTVDGLAPQSTNTLEDAGGSDNGLFENLALTRISVEIPLSGPDWNQEKGRIVAGLTRWLDYEEIEVTNGRILFQGGGIEFLGGASLRVRLDMHPNSDIEQVDEIAAMIGSFYTKVAYGLDAKLTAGELVRYFQRVDLPVAFVSEERITVRVPSVFGAFVDIMLGNDVLVEIRLSEDRHFRMGNAGIMKFVDLATILSRPTSFDDLVDDYATGRSRIA